MIASLIALGITLLFAGYNLALGLVFQTSWYIAIATYFFAFAFLRLTVVIYRWLIWPKTKDREINIYITNGFLMIALIIALSWSVMEMVIVGRPTISGTIPAITMAAYTFYKLGVAIKKAVKAQKKDDYAKRTVRCINLAEVFVSLITLSVTLVTTFEAGEDANTLIIMTSSIMVTLIALLAVKMVVEGFRAKRLLKKSRSLLSEQE